MRGFWTVILGLWCFFGIRANVRAASYYVSAGGDDAQSGTSSGQAWQTLARINRQAFAPGDRILLHGGDVFAGSVVLTSAGTAEKPITLASYGRGKATVSAGNGTGILIRNAGGGIVNNLIVMGAGRETNKASGLVFRNELPGNTRLNFVRIDNVEAHGFGQHGILVEGAASDKSQSGYKDVQITRCASWDNAHTGIYVTGVFDTHTTRYANAGIVVDHCVAYDNTGNSAYLENHSGSGIFLEDVDGGRISRCVARNNGALCRCKAGGPIGIWAAAANNIVIEHCESHHNRTSDVSLDGGGFDLDGGVTNSTMQYNYSHDNDGAGYLIYNYPGAPYTFRNNTVRYNISQNDGRRGGYGAIHVGGDVRDCYLFNNTLFVGPSPSSAPRALHIEGGQNIRCANNILVTTGGVPLLEVSGAGSVLLRGNCYWSSGERFQILWRGKAYGGLNAFQLATRQETRPEANGGTAVGMETDPLLMKPGYAPTLDNADRLITLDAYRLRKDSPLINAGVNLAVYYGIRVGDQDFYADRIPNGRDYDMGAHERK